VTIASGQKTPSERVPALVEQFKGGLAAPICLTWEWTYACNLSCTHCLSSSGRRDPGELTTAEMRSVIDEQKKIEKKKKKEIKKKKKRKKIF
jgi:MoaA/NifB/PqqE/SkfB family radical SAM enzyme